MKPHGALNSVISGFLRIQRLNLMLQLGPRDIPTDLDPLDLRFRGFRSFLSKRWLWLRRIWSLGRLAKPRGQR